MDHKQEIIKTRTLGLGSSDAKMIASVGRTGQLNETAKKRIAEMLGLKERDEVSTYSMQIGNEIEQLIFESLTHYSSDFCKVTSNPFYQSEELTDRFGFGIFNHIDVEMVMPKKIVWYEIKATIKDIDKTEDEYRYQLAWHWMLLAEKEMIENKNSVLMLAHYDTSEGVEVFEHSKINTKQISYVDCKPYIDEIIEGLDIVKDELKNFVYEPKTETNGDNLPDEIQKLIPSINNLLRQAKEYQEKAEELKEKLKEAMEESGTDWVDNEMFKATYVKAGIQSRFDSKQLQKENPEIYSKYLKNSNVKSQLRITLK